MWDCLHDDRSSCSEEHWHVTDGQTDGHTIIAYTTVALHHVVKTKRKQADIYRLSRQELCRNQRLRKARWHHL